MMVPDASTMTTVLIAFKAALENESIVPTDDFFSLGGDSLAAIELIASLEDDFSIDLGVEEIFEYPTPIALASRVQEIRGAR